METLDLRSVKQKERERYRTARGMNPKHHWQDKKRYEGKSGGEEGCVEEVLEKI